MRVGGAAGMKTKDQILESQRRSYTTWSEWWCGRSVERMHVNAKSESGELRLINEDARPGRYGQGRQMVYSTAE